MIREVYCERIFFERLIINQQNLVAYATDTDTNEIIYMTQAAASSMDLSMYRTLMGRNAMS